MDGVFEPGESGFRCLHCTRGMADHMPIEGEGQFEGWVRYVCQPADVGFAPVE